MENLGLLFALGAAVCWGSYMVPFKRSKAENLAQFQVMVGFGVLVSTSIISFFAGYSFNLSLYGLLAGLIWASGNALSLIAIENLGISKAVPLLSSLVILGSFFWGAVVFGELPGIMVSLLAMALIIAGVGLIGSVGGSQSKNTKKGMLFGIIAGVIFASQFVPVKLAGLASSEYFFSMGIGVLVSSLIFFLLQKGRFDGLALKEGFLSGIIWNLGNFLFVLSMSLIGLAKGGAISQSAILIAVLWGLFYFKEITRSKDRKQIMIGVAVLLSGVAVLSMA